VEQLLVDREHLADLGLVGAEDDPASGVPDAEVHHLLAHVGALQQPGETLGALFGDGVAGGEVLEGGRDHAVDVEGGRGGGPLDDAALDLAGDPEADPAHPD